MDWWEIKYWVEQSVGLHMDALHVHAGVLAQLLLALVLRRSLGSIWPWLILLAAQIANEWWDLTYEIWPTRDEQWDESIRDTWNTMLLPTLLLTVSRFVPGLLVPKDREAVQRAQRERCEGLGSQL